MTRIHYLQIISDKIYNILGKERDIKIKEESVLVGSVGEDIIGLSSIDVVRLIVDIEEEFGIVIDFDANLRTVGNIIDYIIENKDDAKYKISKGD